MSDGNYEYKNSFKLMKILLFFIYFFKVNSSCKITVPESVTSQKLNNNHKNQNNMYRNN